MTKFYVIGGVVVAGVIAFLLYRKAGANTPRNNPQTSVLNSSGRPLGEHASVASPSSPPAQPPKQSSVTAAIESLGVGLIGQVTTKVNGGTSVGDAIDSLGFGKLFG